MANMGSVNDSFFTKIISLHTGILAFVLTLFDFISHRVFMRFRVKGKANPDYQVLDTEGFEHNHQEPKSYLTFRFQRYEEFYGKDVEPVSGKGVEHVSAESVHITADNNDGSEKGDENKSSMDEVEFSKPSGMGSDDQAGSEMIGCDDDPNVGESDEEDTEHYEDRAFEDNQGFDNLQADKSFHIPIMNEDSLEKFNFDAGDDFMVSSSDSDSGSLISSSKFSFVSSSLLDSLSDGFLSDSEFDESFDKETSSEKSHDEKVPMQLDMLSSGYEAEEKLLQEHEELDQSNSETGFGVPAESTPKEDSGCKENVSDGTESDEENDEKSNSVMGKILVDYEDQSSGMETEWEHQDLIEQLKMEIKKVRATGLPTILEESEFPKITDDLKPWKIEDKYQHQGTMDEVHKFYKSYRDKMRKFDILNYQKMYAIGFLKLNDPLESFSSNRHSASARAIAAIVSQDCWPCKPRKYSEPNPMAQFTRELESNLEMVYVGQLCLSWEFLHWEYGKALDLWDSDPLGLRRYNEVAGEFQKFQVLLQRFLEDEPFQGPRVPNYVKKRCVHRHLLQVPVIREDNLRDKKGRSKGSGKDAITSVMLVEIIEESIRILWQFIRSDKDAHIAVLNCLNRSNVQLENPADANLFVEIQKDLQKKYKKLKEVLRSERCILRKFQKHHHHGEEILDPVQCFFSQVDMKLVSRVVNMSRLTTDQLAWCSSKVNSIKFVGRKIDVEPSFLQFPCT